MEILYLPFDSSNHKGLFKKFSDINIIEGVRRQDDKILNWLYDAYLQTVKKYVLGNSGSEEDVSDVFQDTIIVLYNQISSDNLHLTTDLKGYFFGIARNVWSAQLRKKQKTIEKGEYFHHVRFAKPLLIRMDGKKRMAVVSQTS